MQTLLIGTVLIFGGVLKQAKENAFQLFHEKVANRKEYLQREMKNNWTNFEPYLLNLQDAYGRADGNWDQFFEEALDDMLSMLKSTQTTGAFLILASEEQQETFPALYLRDYDPLTNSYENEDVYILYGSSELAKENQMPLDQTWRHYYKLTSSNRDFMDKTISNASSLYSPFLLGYWSKPFQLNDEDLEVITYSVPFYSKEGELIGVLGVDITLNYLAEFLPATEIQPKDSLGYLIGYRQEASGEINSLIMNGNLQKRIVKQSESLNLITVDSERNIFQLQNHSGTGNIYVAKEEIGLYQENTPFHDNHWYLIGIMSEDYLLSYVNRIIQILWISLAMSIVVGSIGGILSSYELSKPIIKMVKKIAGSKNRKQLKLELTGLSELDELLTVISEANNEILESASRLSNIIDLFELPIAAFEINHSQKDFFTTNYFWEITGISKHNIPISYDDFLRVLEHTFSKVSEQEADVFCLSMEADRWIRYKVQKDEMRTIGVIMDVTKEYLEKQEIRTQRDQDPLTGLLNRKAFQYAFETWSSKKTTDISALLMFDLDNLKGINDTYGHKWGDQYIKKAVEFLQDIGNPNEKVLGRRSGDEFVMLLTGYLNKEDLLKDLEDAYTNRSKYFMEVTEKECVTVSISSGIVFLDQESKIDTYEEYLQLADEALYQAKETKKGSYIVYDEKRF